MQYTVTRRFWVVEKADEPTRPLPSPPFPPPQKKTDKRFRAKNWRNSDKNKSYIMQILFVLNLLFRMIIRLEMNIIDSSGLFHVMIVFFHWKRQLTRSVIE